MLLVHALALMASGVPLLARITANTVRSWLPVVWTCIALLALLILWITGVFGRLLQRITRVRGFGIEFKFDAETARLTRDTLEPAFELLMQTIRREIEAMVRAKGLQACLKTVIQNSSLSRAANLRATIHIVDPLYRDYLYQVIDYFPSGGGHGRRFSTRAGLIGLVWRTEQWRSLEQSNISIDLLVKEWGMTSREAAARHVVGKVRSMLAVPIAHPAGAPTIGVLYMDSRTPGMEHQNLRKVRGNPPLARVCVVQ
jgi:hypothetical protein